MWSQAAGKERKAVRVCQVVLLVVLCLRSCFCGDLKKREGLEGGLSPVYEGAMLLPRIKVCMKHGKDAHMREMGMRCSWDDCMQPLWMWLLEWP